MLNLKGKYTLFWNGPTQMKGIVTEEDEVNVSVQTFSWHDNRPGHFSVHPKISGTYYDDKDKYDEACRAVVDQRSTNSGSTLNVRYQ